MGITYGADELDLCSHKHAYPAGARDHHRRVMPRIRPYLDKKLRVVWPTKILCERNFVA